MTINEAIEKFTRDLTNRRKAEKTVQTYTTALNHLRTFLRAETDIAPESAEASVLTCDHAVAFVKFLAAKDLSRASLGVYTTATSAFWTWLVTEKIAQFTFPEWTAMQAGLQHWRKGLKVHRLPRLPDEQEAQAVLAATQNHANVRATTAIQRQVQQLIALRNRAIVETLRCTGARVHEVCKLSRANLDTERKRAMVAGKGDKERILRFDDTAWSAIQEYLQALDGTSRASGNGQPVFIRHDRAARKKALRLSTNAIRNILTGFCQQAGTHITPHQFRHRFATLMLEQTGGDIRAVQKLLGHSSLQTTEVYAEVRDARLDAMYEAAEL